MTDPAIPRLADQPIDPEAVTTRRLFERLDELADENGQIDDNAGLSAVLEAIYSLEGQIVSLRKALGLEQT